MVKQQSLEYISGNREIISDKHSYVKYDRAQGAHDVHHMSYHQAGVLEEAGETEIKTTTNRVGPLFKISFSL